MVRATWIDQARESGSLIDSSVKKLKLSREK